MKFLLEKFSSPRKVPITTVVIHATGGKSLAGAISALLNRKLSYHYIIDVDGTVTKLVPITRAAWHAGKSTGPNGDSVNRYSIGISLVNDGKSPYPQEQVAALVKLIKELAFGITPLKWITTHSRISPGRKIDPYKQFPYKEVLAEIEKTTRLRNWEPEGFVQP